MNTIGSLLAAVLFLGTNLLLGALPVRAGEEAEMGGEPLTPDACGPSYVETLDDAVARDITARAPENNEDRRGRPGVWMIPSRGATTHAHSGAHNVVNRWGDTRMGIGFPGRVNVHGAYIVGQADHGAWTTGVRAIGYRGGEAVQETEWFRDIGVEPRWFAMDLHDIERLEIEAKPVLRGAGWYALDDLTYSGAEETAETPAEPIVVDFDDLPYRYQLTGSGYAGLDWEYGTGEIPASEGVHSPMIPPQARGVEAGAVDAAASGTRATRPTLLRSFQGVIRGDAGSMSYPPDTDGAIGPAHYVETVNRNFAVYNKTTGAQLANILLSSFLPGSNGDPRVLYDQYSGRWIVIVTDFDDTATDYLAVSLTSDPTGGWFKTSFVTAQGVDSGCWPDYPTLGVDANGIYTSSYMVGCGMTIFAIDKAPLIAASPSLGTITAFRGLAYENAIQPAHTFGTATGEYFVSTPGGTSLRIRRVNPPLTAPTLTELGTVTVPAYSAAPNAPALGSSTALNTVDERLMMAVFRGSSLWTAHTITANGRAACRWYEINPSTLTLAQSGTVADALLHYYFPSVMVTQSGHVGMGFTGSNASQYAACYYTGRRSTDPPGEMATPALFKAGTGAQNNIDSYGRNRWGDYSYCTLDPSDQNTVWTIQEYGHGTDIWGTYVGVLSFGPQAPTAENVSAFTASNQPVEVTLVATDPEGDPLTYIITSLPTSGSLSDPQAGAITAVPYTLAGGGNLVAYQPPCGTNVADTFTYQARDLLAPSNTATVTVTVGGRQLVYDFPMNTDPQWTTEGLWAFGQPTGGGTHNLDPTSGHTGSNVYGYNLNGDYPTGMSATYLTTPALDCTGKADVELRFWKWLGIESATFDHASVEVSSNGTSWTTIWTHTGAAVRDQSWSEMVFNISAVADFQPTVYIRWGMGPTDNSVTFPGWNIDDVQIWAAVPVVPGDLDGSGVVDLADFAVMSGCISGPGGGIGVGCQCVDLDADSDVDLADFAAFEAAFPD